jgi:hypothetical protein
MSDSNVLYSIFIKHPEEQNMTYFEHLKHAFSYGIGSLYCSIVFVVHGFIPCLFEKTGSTMIKDLNDRLHRIKTKNEKTD